MTLKEIINMQPDGKGIITIILDGRERRFMKDKFLLSLNGCDTLPKIKKPRAEKPAPVKKVKKQPKPKKEKLPRNTHRKQPIIAVLPNGVEKRYESRVAAVDELKIGRNAIWRCLDGSRPNVKGISFKPVQIQI